MVAPLVAVTVTLNLPNEEETVSVEVAEVVVEDSVTLGGLSIVVARPEGTVAARLTVPENPLDPATVIVDPPEYPELIVSEDGLDETPKSGTGTMKLPTIVLRCTEQ